MTDPSSAAGGRRRRLLVLVTTAILLGLVIFGVYWLRYGRYHVDTDDAYVGGNRDAVTAQVAGIVVSIQADNTERVHRGQVLAELDPTDADIALAAAEARLASAVRSARSDVLQVAELSARRDAAVAALHQAVRNARRAQRLFRGGALARSKLESAELALRRARAARAAADATLARARAMVRGGDLEREPAVRAAEAAVQRAYVARSRCVLRAPVTGYVAQRSVELGQEVHPGEMLMTVVPLQQVWVTANFKEPQLRTIRIGEPVRMTSDWYGDDVVYHGRVAGIGAGSGSAFSLLPPENASGNWIKIVQRVPVRVTLSPAELARHPLRIGLSMNTVITTGPALPKTRAVAPAHYHTDVFSGAEVRARKRIMQILQANTAPRHAS